MSDGKPWRDEEFLRQKYLREEMTTYEIADEIGCSGRNVLNWLNKFGIETRDAHVNNCGKPWMDKDTLREAYVEERCSVTDIAERWGCSESTVCNWLNRHEIELRYGSQQYASYGVYNGYETWSTTDTTVYVHQLLAIADGADPYAVFSSEYHVHHTDGQPLHNLAENLEVKLVSDHVSDHRKLSCEPSRDELREMYVEEKMSLRDISDRLGCDKSTVSKWLSKHGISTRDAGGKYRDKYLYKDEEVLYEMYVEREMTITEIADEVGCCANTVSNWLDRHGIQTRSTGPRPSAGNEQ